MNMVAKKAVPMEIKMEAREAKSGTGVLNTTKSIIITTRREKTEIFVISLIALLELL